MDAVQLQAQKIRSLRSPLRVAWQQALAGLRLRWQRQMLTAFGIALATAFFAVIRLQQVSEAEFPSGDPGAKVRLVWLFWSSATMCVIGITNSMLLSVGERTREIGTMKCIGASDRFVIQVFFLEALLLGGMSTIAGALISGLVAPWIANPNLSWAMRWPVLGFATGISLGITVFSALIPAIAAARLPAAAALRREL